MQIYNTYNIGLGDGTIVIISRQFLTFVVFTLQDVPEGRDLDNNGVLYTKHMICTYKNGRTD